MSDDDREYRREAARLLASEDAQPSAIQSGLQALGASLLGEFNQAVLDRSEIERRWLNDLRQYRGKYEPDVEQMIEPGQSRTFVRKTRVKIKTADSRVADLLFPAGVDKNWSLDSSPKPALSLDQRQEIRKLLLERAQGQKVTRAMFDAAVLEWSKVRASGMSTTIHDQLGEVAYKSTCRKALHSGHLYGTGIIKGPLVERRVRTRFVKQGGKWLPQSETYVVPFVEYVPVWRWYPDMTATELRDCHYVWERHLFRAHQMADLAARRSFRGDLIKAHVLANPDGMMQSRSTDSELRAIGEREAVTHLHGTYEVLERWGWMRGDKLRDAGVPVPDGRLHESFFSNIWILPDGTVIKAVLQPINGTTWPYHLYYVDKDESSIFAEGFAAIMRDDQDRLNAVTRMVIDNGALATAGMLESNPHLLSNPDDAQSIAPRKVFLRNQQHPGQRAVHAIDVPSRVAELSGMISIFETNADEVTAIPRYVSGENVTAGAAGTASGLSMMLGNVTIVLKDLVSNWDEGVTEPFITAMNAWNMQFHPDDTIKGDFTAKATATASLVAKEVRARQLNEFAVMTDNPSDAPYVKRHHLLLKRAEANELVDCVKSEEELRQESESEGAKAMLAMQQKIQQLQLAEAQAKVSTAMAQAEQLQAKAKETIANIDLIVAKAVSARVEAAYAALQAGGVATSTPQIAPAGDEILRSSGWQDKTPEPSMAQLNGPPVQAEQAPSAAAADPRSGRPPDGLDPAAGVDAPTGMVGRRSGIETAAIE